VSEKLEAAMKLEAEIVAYLGAINLLLGLYIMYALLLNSCTLPSKSGIDYKHRKADALAERRARSRFESLTTTLANLYIQTQTVSKNVAHVRYQVAQGTHVVVLEERVSLGLMA
jgi:hypothetical protein